jgi:pyridoxamine 5'-phosphate oxidase
MTSADRTPAEEPIARFQRLLANAKRIPADVLPDPTAFALATVDAGGNPSVRIVLLKGVDERGFVFYTNHESRKGRELLTSRRAALCFHWQLLEIQVRVEGRVETVSDADADAYFATRPRSSQIGAWASQQSAPLASRAALDESVREVEQRFANAAVTRPPFWRGFRVVARSIEFWTRDPARLHERVVFQRSNGEWSRSLLFP